MPSVVLLNVIPAFGNLLASLMLVSPVPAVLKLRATGKLGDLNPLPLPLTAYNAMGWLAYGIVTSNPYLFPSNLIGFVAGVFFTLTAHSAAPRQVQDRILCIMLLGSVHFITMTIVALFSLTQQAAERMWGTNAIIILMVYYLIPLSSMYDIIRRKNAISIYPPLACGAIANGGLWTVYGFALKDVNLWLPNLFGVVIGVVQLVLRAVYGAVPETAQTGVSSAGPVSMTLSSSPKPPLKTPSSSSRGGGSDGLPHAETPEQHPAAKHPAAKEPRRPSILALLHPYQYMSAQLGDVEKGGTPGAPSSFNSVTVVATATSTAIKPQLQGQL